MRTFNFRARNIGEEKYLSYTMGEDCELDEDVWITVRTMRRKN